MCGIAGIISTDSSQVSLPQLSRMAVALSHRGPDGEGFWIHDEGLCGFAHRRLSILDKTPKAAQPLHYMHYIIMLNGEIYNYLELKEYLIKKGYTFFTEGDTEIIPAAFDHWGKDCLHQFDGMFAFVLYDKNTHELFIARDRFGEKPFYYILEKKQECIFDNFIFASEMKAFWAIGYPKEFDVERLLPYLVLGKITGFADKKNTFYKNIFSLPQGHSMTIQLKSHRLEIEKWYQPTITKISQDKEETLLIKEFYSLLETSVNRRLRSHVNTGNSLSGGIDSATIAAMIHNMKSPGAFWKNICFTASFPGFEKDELEKSKEVATFLDIQQEILYPSENDWAENFDTLMYHQEEPLQSSSVLTQFLVYRKAKEHNIRVILDGQGADEILGGYTKYTRWFLQDLWRNNKTLFHLEKQQLSKNRFLEKWDMRDYLTATFPKTIVAAYNISQKRKLKSSGFIHPELMEEFLEKDLSLQKIPIGFSEQLTESSFHSGLDELLRYADRNSMANSLEVRLPFLNHAFVEFIFSMPDNFKIRNGYTKWMLRQAMKNKLPEKIIWAKGKTGYEPPQENWMKSKMIQDMVMSARKKLVDHKILNKAIMHQNIMAKSAHAPENFDWRFLCAATLLK
ncbi:MAG: asparagine synthase (glutamine-hydrolyzing) [Bacteroidetes bacterium]|nr:asparagine synthase (glutamine-hydrolyzing) [Bacteroidota bacterium]